MSGRAFEFGLPPSSEDKERSAAAQTAADAAIQVRCLQLHCTGRPNPQVDASGEAQLRRVEPHLHVIFFAIIHGLQAASQAYGASEHAQQPESDLPRRGNRRRPQACLRRLGSPGIA